MTRNPASFIISKDRSKQKNNEKKEVIIKFSVRESSTFFTMKAPCARCDNRYL